VLEKFPTCARLRRCCDLDVGDQVALHRVNERRVGKELRGAIAQDIALGEAGLFAVDLGSVNAVLPGSQSVNRTAAAAAVSSC
jgi:hypothetical protein